MTEIELAPTNAIVHTSAVRLAMSRPASSRCAGYSRENWSCCSRKCNTTCTRQAIVDSWQSQAKEVQLCCVPFQLASFVQSVCPSSIAPVWAADVMTLQLFFAECTFQQPLCVWQACSPITGCHGLYVMALMMSNYKLLTCVSLHTRRVSKSCQRHVATQHQRELHSSVLTGTDFVFELSLMCQPDIAREAAVMSICVHIWHPTSQVWLSVCRRTCWQLWRQLSVLSMLAMVAKLAA